jgi:two-component system, cell cycle sensor histidine kinase and response regulator CckA
LSTPLQVLLAEDSEDDATLLIRELRRLGYDPAWQRVDDATAMREAIGAREWDIVFSDSSMPSFSARAALSLLQEAGSDIPFVIVSGTIGEEAAVEVIRAGASDFLLKGKLARLGPVVERELRDRRGRLLQRRAEEEQRASEARHSVLFESSPLPMLVFDTATLALLTVNDAAIRQYGYSREELLAMTMREIVHPEDHAALRLTLDKPVRDRGRYTRRDQKKDGSIITVEVASHDFAFGGRRATLGVVQDVTERLKLEDQLRQSQKMEAVGRLAGGIAHDFNNVLSVILSYGELVLADLSPDSPIRSDIEEIRNAGRRAADLTRQLLMFSRQQVLEPKVLDMNEVLSGMDKMLKRILGADVDLVSLSSPRLGSVRADPGSLEQVIVNLAVNARDAMPTGGKLTMETANVALDEEYARKHVGVQPGPHVMLAVTDTGTGMDRATQARIFEPFFTTKGKGKGTGLGLSTVFGIVQQSGGSIWVYSEPGEGTTFKVYLPRVDAAAERLRSSRPPANLRGSETILLVEDDEQVRAVARAILRHNGYEVVESRSPGEALLLSERHRGKIHLLLTDVVMPQMGGPELAKRLAAQRPDIKVLCMSGYTDDSIVRHGILESSIAYLQKPLTPEALTSKVREVLDSK